MNSKLLWQWTFAQVDAFDQCNPSGWFRAPHDHGCCSQTHANTWRDEILVVQRCRQFHLVQIAHPQLISKKIFWTRNRKSSWREHRPKCLREWMKQIHDHHRLLHIKQLGDKDGCGLHNVESMHWSLYLILRQSPEGATRARMGKKCKTLATPSSSQNYWIDGPGGVSAVFYKEDERHLQLSISSGLRCRKDTVMGHQCEELDSSKSRCRITSPVLCSSWIHEPYLWEES